MSHWRCQKSGCLGDRTASTGELMPPAAAHRQAHAPVRASVVAAAAATPRLVVHPPHLVALDLDHERRAVAALLELLTAALDANEAAEPSLPNRG
jgi:hypothetical protein